MWQGYVKQRQLSLWMGNSQGQELLLEKVIVWWLKLLITSPTMLASIGINSSLIFRIQRLPKIILLISVQSYFLTIFRYQVRHVWLWLWPLGPGIHEPMVNSLDLSVKLDISCAYLLELISCYMLAHVFRKG